jgi:hypothetical protein
MHPTDLDPENPEPSLDPRTITDRLEALWFIEREAENLAITKVRLQRELIEMMGTCR